MLTVLQTKKFSHHFQLLDADGSGSLNWNDFEALLSRLQKARGWEPTSARADQARDCYKGFWEALRAQSKSADLQGVTLQDWLAYHHAALCESQVLGQLNPLYEQLVMTMSKFVQESLDDDGDGKITSEEYSEFSKAYGVSDSDAKACFKGLDRNGDGVLTRAEILDLVLEYYCSDDPNAPGNQFFGILPL